MSIVFYFMCIYLKLFMSKKIGIGNIKNAYKCFCFSLITLYIHFENIYICPHSKPLQTT